MLRVAASQPTDPLPRREATRPPQSHRILLSNQHSHISNTAFADVFDWTRRAGYHSACLNPTAGLLRSR